MFTKLVRFIAVLAVIGILGTFGAVRAAPPSSTGTALSLAATNSLGVQFVQVATADNIAGSATSIDHPLINGDPSAVIIATPNWNPGGFGGTYNNHPIAVTYFLTKWLIINQDSSAMPINAAFNVLVPKAGPNALVHTATATNTAYNYTMIDNPLTNGNPNAKILVTPKDTTSSHPIGVWYDGTKWGIFNQDLAAMPVGISFHVFVLPENYPGAFVHTATAGNTLGNVTSIDHPLTNNNPNAMVFVTPNWNPGGGSSGTYNNHNIGVWYDSVEQKWSVFNQDLATMPANAAFNVLVLVPQSATFVHKATSANSSGNVTYIDHSLTNSDPNAIVFVTPNWNPGGSSSGTYNNHNIGVWYNPGQQKWSVFNQDIATMPNNAAFNVLIPHPDTSVFVHKVTTANTSGHITTIDHPLTNNKPNAIILVTPNWNPGGVGGTYNDHPIGVYYAGNKWKIFNQDLVAMPTNAAFNVIIPRPGPGEAVFVHQASAANTSGHVTYIDHPLTNNNPAVLVLVTPNWNSGGSGGTYNNHPIGVYYEPSNGKWAIFNQDLASIQIGAAFNVFVTANRVYLPLVIR